MAEELELEREDLMEVNEEEYGDEEKLDQFLDLVEDIQARSVILYGMMDLNNDDDDECLLGDFFDNVCDSGEERDEIIRSIELICRLGEEFKVGSHIPRPLLVKFSRREVKELAMQTKRLMSDSYYMLDPAKETIRTLDELEACVTCSTTNVD